MSGCDKEKKVGIGGGGGGSVCRTINLSLQEPCKPDMQVYHKCAPLPDTCELKELPFQATRTGPKVCKKKVLELPAPKLPRSPSGGKFVNAIKIGVLAGTIYFTASEGVWGDQQDAAACLIRWQDYVRSINSRRPSKYDACGNLLESHLGNESVVAPLYAIYKEFVFNSFLRIARLPADIKCFYFQFHEMMAQKHASESQAKPK